MLGGNMIGAEQIMELVGKNIELLCFAQYSLYIHLEDKILITVESGFEHVHSGTRRVCHLSSPPVDCSVLAILESTVRSVVIAQNGELQLTFSNGDSLRVFKETKYESYRIKIGVEELIP
jgi:Family of unknown function (DUF6188)